MLATRAGSFDSEGPVCYSRPLLYRAEVALESGNWIESGVLLRESIYQLLKCRCEFHDCLPTQKFDLSAMGMLKALQVGKHLDSGTFETLSKIIAACNKTAHCEYVDASLLRRFIALAYCHFNTARGVTFSDSAGNNSANSLTTRIRYGQLHSS